MNSRRKLMNVAGASLLEIILAVGVMVLAAPVAYRFVSRELNETRHLGIARQMQDVRRALLNYASVERKNWSDKLSGGLEGDDVALKMKEDYGLNPDAADSITGGMQVRYVRAQGEYFEVFGALYLDGLGLDDAGFKQVLLLVGDEAGYVDDGRIYSITGAWEKSAQGLGLEFSPHTAIIRITDADLSAEYSSAEFLYRNTLGGDEGSRMFVPLDMNKNAIRGFRVMWGEKIAGAHDVVFSNAIFGGGLRLAQNLLLRGTLRFIGNARISTPLLALKMRSFLFGISAPSATITAATGGEAAEVNVMGEVSMPSLAAETLVFQGLDPRGSYRVSGDNLQIVLRTIYGGDLFASSIVLENGMLAGGERKSPFYFAADYGLLSLPQGAQAVVYNAGIDEGIDLQTISFRMADLNARLMIRLQQLEQRKHEEKQKAAQ